MTVWQSIQVKTITQPVGDPADWIEEPPGTQSTGGWLVPTNQAVQPTEYRHLLPWLAYQGEPAGFVEGIEAEVVPAWHFNRDPVQPTLVPSEAFYQGNPTDFVEGLDAALVPLWHYNRDPVIWLIMPGAVSFEQEPEEVPTAADLVPIWHFNRDALFPLLVPGQTYYQGDPAGFVEPADEFFFPAWHFNRDAVWPIEYRYLLPWFFREFDIPLEDKGVLVLLPQRAFSTGLRARSLEAILPERGLEVALRQGGRVRE